MNSDSFDEYEGFYDYEKQILELENEKNPVIKIIRRKDMEK